MVTAGAPQCAIWRRRRFVGYAFIAPVFVFLCAVVLFPLAHAFWTSLHRVRGLDAHVRRPAELRARAGRRGVLALARRLARSSPRACVALHMLLGLALALLLNQLRFARTALRIAFLTPWMVAPAVGATIWLWLLEPQFGVVNYLLRPRASCSAPLAWLGEPGARVRFGGRGRRLARRAVRHAADARGPADDSARAVRGRGASTARTRGSGSAT